MVWKGRSLALAVLVWMPFGVLAEDGSSQQARETGGQYALLPSETPRPLDPWTRPTAYGFGDNNSRDVEFESLDHLLDAALYEADGELAAMQGGRPGAVYMPFATQQATRPRRDVAVRLGGWYVSSEGDPTKVGEYQGLESSAFWDIDVLSSDGKQTLDMTLTGLDNESTMVDLSVFGPRLSMDLDYQRFLHRLDHDPLTNLGDLLSNEEIVREDLNVGEDYAVRIQDLKYVLKGKVTENTKARVNFRMLRKSGERQANTVEHCSDSEGGGNSVCHVLSQRQRIDWLTVKIEPVIETNLGPVRVEYSRPMRFFSQNDQVVAADYGDFNPSGGDFHPPGLGEEAYAVVPESYSQTDRLKLGVDLGASTNFYANSYIRDTRNKFRDTHRKSFGYDLRLTNRSWDGVKLTAYATVNEQTNQNAPFLFPEEEAALGVNSAIVPSFGIRRPIDYSRGTVGADVSWRPFQRDGILPGLSFTAGTEQGRIERKNATYVVQDLTDLPGTVIDQERTDYISGRIGMSLKWSPSLDTFVRYKLRATNDPLFAVDQLSGFTNTSLPTRENLVEIGGNWMPADNFLVSATFGMENRENRTDIAVFEENNYPVTCTLWYAPTPGWSLSAGYGYYSNWIDQDISFPSDDPANQTGDVRRWNYGGRGQVVSFGSDYAYSGNLLFLAGVEFVNSRDAFDSFEPWPDLPFYSDVNVDRTRVTAGVDWQAYDEISTYLRYIFEDYEDRSVDYNSGTVHMLLVGFNAIY